MRRRWSGGSREGILCCDVRASKQHLPLYGGSSLMLDKFDVRLHRITGDHGARRNAEVFEPPAHHKRNPMTKRLRKSQDHALFGFVVDHQRAQQRHLLTRKRTDHPFDFLGRRIRTFV